MDLRGRTSRGEKQQQSGGQTQAAGGRRAPQDLVSIRSGWFTALWVGGEGESVESRGVKKMVNSGECNFSGRMVFLIHLLELGQLRSIVFIKH